MLRLNPLLVVIAAGFSTGLVGGMSPIEILEAIGKSFITNRYMSLLILILPVIGLLERYGLRERAELLILKTKNVTAGRIMLLYMLFRQVTAGLGLHLGGHPTFIRPLIAPMAEAAVGKGQPVPPDVLEQVRAMSASAENYGNFYGQLLFIAAGGLLLIKGVMEQAGYKVDLLIMAQYAIPTAACALLIAAARFIWFDRQMAKALSGKQSTRSGKGVPQ
jgi:uncharacterized membrane protein